MTLQGKCYPTEMMQEEGFKPAEMITGHKIVFRPDKQLKHELDSNLQLKRLSSEAMA